MVAAVFATLASDDGIHINGEEIRVDGEEIQEAGWFRASAMPKTFPGRVSIAQWLIRDFLERHGEPLPE